MTNTQKYPVLSEAWHPLLPWKNTPCLTSATQTRQPQMVDPPSHSKQRQDPLVPPPILLCSSYFGPSLYPLVSLQHHFPSRTHTWIIRRASASAAVRQLEKSGRLGVVWREERGAARINRRMGAGCSDGRPSVCPSGSLKAGKMAVQLCQGCWEAVMTSASASSVAGGHEAKRCSTGGEERRWRGESSETQIWLTKRESGGLERHKSDTKLDSSTKFTWKLSRNCTTKQTDECKGSLYSPKHLTVVIWSIWQMEWLMGGLDDFLLCSLFSGW